MSRSTKLVSRTTKPGTVNNAVEASENKAPGLAEAWPVDDSVHNPVSNLRTQYLGSPTPGQDVAAEAKITGQLQRKTM